MNHALFLPTLGAFLGLRNLYWLIIIIIVLVILGLAYYARGRAV